MLFKRTKFEAFSQLHLKLMLQHLLGFQGLKLLLETRPWRQTPFPGNSDVMHITWSGSWRQEMGDDVTAWFPTKLGQQSYLIGDNTWQAWLLHTYCFKLIKVWKEEFNSISSQLRFQEFVLWIILTFLWIVIWTLGIGSQFHNVFFFNLYI